MYTCIYTCTCIYTYVYIYMYICIYTERESIYSTYIHTYQYIHIYTYFPPLRRGLVRSRRGEVEGGNVQAWYASGCQACNQYIQHIYTVYNTKGTRAHTHRELIQEWLWELKGTSLGYIEELGRGVDAATLWPRTYTHISVHAYMYITYFGPRSLR